MILFCFVQLSFQDFWMFETLWKILKFPCLYIKGDVNKYTPEKLQIYFFVLAVAS